MLSVICNVTVYELTQFFFVVSLLCDWRISDKREEKKKQHSKQTHIHNDINGRECDWRQTLNSHCHCRRRSFRFVFVVIIVLLHIHLHIVRCCYSKGIAFLARIIWFICKTYAEHASPFAFFQKSTNNDSLTKHITFIPTLTLHIPKFRRMYKCIRIQDNIESNELTLAPAFVIFIFGACVCVYVCACESEYQSRGSS